MKVVINREKVAIISFLGLTVFFVVYNTMISIGLIPKFIGGGYGFISFIVFMFVLLNFKSFLIDLSRHMKFSIPFLYYFIYVLLVSVLSTIADPLLNPAFQHMLINYVHGFVLFYIGYYLTLNSILLNKFLKITTLISFFLLAYYYIKTGNLMFNANSLEVNDEEVASYQTFGRTAFLCISLLIVNIKPFIYRLIFFIIGTFILFILGARSEAVGFLLFGLSFIVFSSGLNLFKLSVLVAVITSTLFLLYSNIDLVMDTRFGQLADFQQSSSWLAREEFYIYAQSVIKDHFILGSFGSSFLHFDNVGSNAHNIIAVWANYGILGLMLFISCSIFPIFISFYLIAKGSRDPNLIFSLLFGTVCLFLLFIAKSNFWIIPPFYWGVFLGYFRKNYVSN